MAPVELHLYNGVAGAQKKYPFVNDKQKLYIIPHKSGKRVLYIYDNDEYWAFGSLANELPAGDYIVHNLNNAIKYRFYLGFLLGAYQCNHYKTTTNNGPLVRLVVDDEIEAILAEAGAVNWVRDLINQPPNKLTPSQLMIEAFTLAKDFGAEFRSVSGDALAVDFPLIHAVGRGSANPPQFFEFFWGDEQAPRVTLVGKGICFDSGGLDLKESGPMSLMKKDMGGSAHALGLARLIMAGQLPLRLHCVVGAAENMPDGNAYRTSDILTSKKGISVEVGNTDAEGRLVLADCLTHCGQYNPDLMIDFATLTGAARVAVGTQMAALFTENNDIARDLMAIGAKIHDPIWQLPLFMPYKKILKSALADIGSTGNSPYAGASVAALFLHEFVANPQNWLHFDIMAWNIKGQPAKPEGGEAMAVRALYYYLKNQWLPGKNPKNGAK